MCRILTIFLISFGIAWQSAAPINPKQSPTDKTSLVIPLSARILIATKLYSAIECSFGQWTAVSRSEFDSNYQVFIDTILKDVDRRGFDLAAMRFVASMHNGHTFFTDAWLEAQPGQTLGFNALYLENQWVVTESEFPNLAVGSVIDTLDGVQVEDYFQRNQFYIADSSDRAQRTDFFSLALLFPATFSLGLHNGQTVAINRSAQSKSTPSSEASGRWLDGAPFKPSFGLSGHSGSVAYIKIPSFQGVTSEASALGLVQKFRAAAALIIDLRGNPGGFGNPPDELQMAFMNRPYRTWIETSSASVGRLASLHYESGALDSGPVWMHPEGRPGTGLFQGKLILLVDRECGSYCEEFVLPLKLAGRAEVIGEPTAGTYAQTRTLDLSQGMKATIAATKEISPDGAPFEGIGISPTVRVDRKFVDVQSGTDVVLQTAITSLTNR